MQEIILKIRYFERELPKNVKKINFIFSSEPVIYYLTKFDDVIESGFWGISKTTSANFCKSIYELS